MDSIKIPRNIFQTWETKNISNGFKSLIETWKSKNKNYNYYFFDDNDRKKFIKDNFDENIYKAYCRIIPGAYRADLWRYCILFINGGIYVDIDTLCFDSIDNFIDENIEFMTPIDLNNCPSYGTYNLSNGFIASIPKHPILMDCIRRIVYNVENNIVPFSNLDFSGPGILGKSTNVFIGNNETESFIGKEGTNNKGIKFLKFDYGIEYVKDNNKILFQNKNGNQSIIDIYNNEIKNIEYTDWGKCKNPIKQIDNFPTINNLSDNSNKLQIKKEYSSLFDYEPELFQVYHFDNKIRLGSTYDNGYVIGLIDTKYDCFISAGISDEDSFTVGFLNKYNLDVSNCYAFDGTINDLPSNIKNKIQFIKKNIGPNNDEMNTNLNDLLENHENIFLKMDIEGSEWEWLNILNETNLKNISQIVIELHGITNNSWHKNFIFNSFNTTIHEKINCLKKMSNTHYLIHAHGNNADKLTYNGIPNVIELTYVNKKYFNEITKLNENELPDKILDFPNEIKMPDVDLNFYPFVNKIKENPFLIHIEDKLDYDEKDYIDIQNKLNEKNIDSVIESMYTYKNKFYELDDFKIRINRGIGQQIITQSHSYPVKTLYKIGNYEDNKNCIVCCTSFKHGDDSSRYSSSNNMYETFKKSGYNGHIYLFQGGFPNPTGKEMKFAGVPYCFKIFMMLEAEKLGFEKIIWIDAACYAVNNPQRLFDILNDDDAIFRQFFPYTPGIPTYESAVFKEIIELLDNITNRNFVNSIAVCSVVFGLNFKSEKIQKFVNEYYEMVKLGTPFLSQFPEEAVISAIFNKDDYKHLFYNKGESHMLFIHENYVCNNFDIAKWNGYYFVQRQN
jgi:mannosyltransferase OCH1-like enzyme